MRTPGCRLLRVAAPGCRLLRVASLLRSVPEKTYPSKGIVSSRTTSYNPQGNGQTERYNGIVWKAITMALKSRNLPPKCWQIVLPDALHSIRSLLSTATNGTPRERLFNFARRSTAGGSVPTWLCTPGPILLKRHVRHSKAEPLVGKVELLQVRSCPLPRWPRNNGVPPAFGPNRRVVSR